MEAGVQDPPKAAEDGWDMEEGSGLAGEELDGEGSGEEAPEEPVLALPGDGKQLSLKVGGAVPDKATVKLRGGSIEIPAGQLDKGQNLNLVIGVRITEVDLIDKMDNSTGEIVGTERRHIAKITKVERV